MFEYDYITKAIKGFRFLVVGDEKGEDTVVGYITPSGVMHRSNHHYPADQEWLEWWVNYELAA